MDIAMVKTVDKPWGKEEILAKTDRYVMKRITITGGKRMSLQYHKVKEETIYVVSGLLVVWKSEKFTDRELIYPGETYHVKPRSIHRFGSPDQTDTIIIECSTPELEDVVRLADDYNRN